MVFGNGWRSDGGDVDVVGFEVFGESQGGLGGMNEDGDDWGVYERVYGGGLQAELIEYISELLAALVELGALLIHRGKRCDGSLGMD